MSFDEKSYFRKPNSIIVTLCANIFANESISRAEMARVTGITRTTISEVVNGLLAEGLVEEIGRGESIGGKSPIL